MKEIAIVRRDGGLEEGRAGLKTVKRTEMMAALHLRLSRDDEGEEESASIKTSASSYGPTARSKVILFTANTWTTVTAAPVSTAPRSGG